MLSYLARTLAVAARARIRRDGTLVSQMSRRVGLRQIDLNLHMNQAVYAQEMELSRTAWVIRSGAWADLVARDIKPVVAEQRIIYRRELKPFTRFTLDSRATGIDGKLLTVETHVLVGDRVHAKGIVKLIFIGPEGVLREEAVPGVMQRYLTDPLPVEGWRTTG